MLKKTDKIRRMQTSGLKKHPIRERQFQSFKPGHFWTFWKGYSKTKWSKIGNFGMTSNVPILQEHRAESKPI